MLERPRRHCGDSRLPDRAVHLRQLLARRAGYASEQSAQFVANQSCCQEGYLLRSPCREDGVETPLRPTSPTHRTGSRIVPCGLRWPISPNRGVPGKPSPMWPRPSGGAKQIPRHVR